MTKKVILVWFRNDLRTLDNEALSTAVEKADFIVPVYIFDPRYYQKNKSDFLNTGNLREQYTYQSVKTLKEKLQLLGGDLLTYEGLPEEILPQLVQKYDIDEVYHHREVAKRETDISELVEEALWKQQKNLRHFIGHTLYHKEDLPFPIRDIPNDFNVFKKKIEKESSVRQALPDLTAVHLPPHIEKTDLPALAAKEQSVGYGEASAFRELEAILSANSKEEDLYIRLSPYLAIGSLSPIVTYHFLHERTTPANKKNTNQIINGLLRRDYYRFMLKKIPNSYFINHAPTVSDPALLAKWTGGDTESTIINNLMHRLNETGNLSYMEREILGMY
jgi:deoxyribodipyrimidine photo-lyase